VAHRDFRTFACAGAFRRWNADLETEFRHQVEKTSSLSATCCWPVLRNDRHLLSRASCSTTSLGHACAFVRRLQFGLIYVLAASSRRARARRSARRWRCDRRRVARPAGLAGHFNILSDDVAPVVLRDAAVDVAAPLLVQYADWFVMRLASSECSEVAGDRADRTRPSRRIARRHLRLRRSGQHWRRCSNRRASVTSRSTSTRIWCARLRPGDSVVYAMRPARTLCRRDPTRAASSSPTLIRHPR